MVSDFMPTQKVLTFHWLVQNHWLQKSQVIKRNEKVIFYLAFPNISPFFFLPSMTAPLHPHPVPLPPPYSTSPLPLCAELPGIFQPRKGGISRTITCAPHRILLSKWVSPPRWE